MAALRNAKHEAVLQRWIADPERIGWRAYAKVYPKSSQRAAETSWSDLLKIPEFRARRDALVAALSKVAVAHGAMSLDEVLLELSHLGRANMADYVRAFDAAGMDPAAAMDELTREQTAALAEITVEESTEGRGDDAFAVRRTKFKLHSKPAALSELRRHHEPSKHQHSDPDGRPLGAAAAEDELNVMRRIAFAVELGARRAAQADKPKPSKASQRSGKRRAGNKGAAA